MRRGGRQPGPVAVIRAPHVRRAAVTALLAAAAVTGASAAAFAAPPNRPPAADILPSIHDIAGFSGFVVAAPGDVNGPLTAASWSRLTAENVPSTVFSNLVTGFIRQWYDGSPLATIATVSLFQLPNNADAVVFIRELDHPLDTSSVETEHLSAWSHENTYALDGTSKSGTAFEERFVTYVRGDYAASVVVTSPDFSTANLLAEPLANAQAARISTYSPPSPEDNSVFYRFGEYVGAFFVVVLITGFVATGLIVIIRRRTSRRQLVVRPVAAAGPAPAASSSWSANPPSSGSPPPAPSGVPPSAPAGPAADPTATPATTGRTSPSPAALDGESATRDVPTPGFWVE